MTILTRLLLDSNKDEEHYGALINRQTKNDKNHDTPRNHAFLPIRSAVMVQCKDGGPLTHHTIGGKGDHNHNNKSYTICVTKTGQVVTRNSKNMKPTQITDKQYHQISWTDTE